MAGTTTILFTDIAGSTELVHQLGDAGGTKIITDHLRLLRAAVERSRGKVVKTLGDGVMAVFSTAYDGAAAAVVMQQAVERDARRGKGPDVGLRIGIHVGDVVDDGPEDLFGAAVVVARRLCDAAGPGQIYASDVVRLLIGNRPEVAFEALATLQLKGIPEAVNASRITWSPLPEEVPGRVVVADDVALIRTGVVRLLSDEGFDVIAEAADYDGLVAAIDRDPPDLVITDIRMPPTNTDEGLRAASYVRANHPGVGILILSQHVEAAAAAELIESTSAGVGYLLKERVGELDQFVDAVRRVAAGQSVVDPIVTEQLLRRHRPDDPVAALTDREREVLDLMAQGLSNQAICERLFLSPKTVETHVRSIFTKLGLPEDSHGNRRVQAVIQWLSTGPATPKRG
jgi:DNA-binding NarL/FixJ family response regulator/class 3 adenylate cyclase